MKVILLNNLPIPHYVLSLTDLIKRRCVWFFDILVFCHRQNWGTKAKWPNHLSLWVSQQVSPASLIKSSQNGMTLLNWLVGYLKRTKGYGCFCLAPQLSIWQKAKYQKSETSSSRGIRINMAKCVRFLSLQNQVLATVEQHDKHGHATHLEFICLLVMKENICDS